MKISNSPRRCRIAKKNVITAVAAAFIGALIFTSYCAFVPLSGEEELYSSIIRFHVLANSDSDEDQALKLSVRDSVTAVTKELLRDCTDIHDAKRILTQNEDVIIEAAERCISNSGYSYSAALKQGFEIYPRREYGNFTFPSGRYYSVRLSIGSGKGKNWWCVLFPPMCTGGAVVEKYESEENLSVSGFSDSEIDIIKEDTSVRREIRFFLLDLINGTVGKD